jgi:hypothetical protein
VAVVASSSFLPGVDRMAAYSVPNDEATSAPLSGPTGNRTAVLIIEFGWQFSRFSKDLDQLDIADGNALQDRSDHRFRLTANCFHLITLARRGPSPGAWRNPSPCRRRCRWPGWPGRRTWKRRPSFANVNMWSGAAGPQANQYGLGILTLTKWSTSSLSRTIPTPNEPMTQTSLT